MNALSTNNKIDLRLKEIFRQQSGVMSTHNGVAIGKKRFHQAASVQIAQHMHAVASHTDDVGLEGKQFRLKFVGMQAKVENPHFVGIQLYAGCQIFQGERLGYGAHITISDDLFS